MPNIFRVNDTKEKLPCSSFEASLPLSDCKSLYVTTKQKGTECCFNLLWTSEIPLMRSVGLSVWREDNPEAQFIICTHEGTRRIGTDYEWRRRRRNQKRKICLAECLYSIRGGICWLPIGRLRPTSWNKAIALGEAQYFIFFFFFYYIPLKLSLH